MDSAKIWIGRWGGLVLKCALSCVAVAVFVSLLDLMRLCYAVQTAPKRPGIESAPPPDANHPAEDLAQSKGVFWPQFPGSFRSSIQQAAINGVQIISQAWDTTVPGRDVIAYYREQMTARGWRDLTEEAYRFRPEMRNPGMGKNSLQDERYLNEYGQVMDSKLVLRRGNWSMQVDTSPSGRRGEQARVSIRAASTPSFERFVSQLASSFGEDKARGGQPLDFVQQQGGSRYHTTVTGKSEAPADAFQAALADLASHGWQPTLFLPKEKTPSGYFAWLVKGRQYAALSVNASERGASVTFTEVTPEPLKNR